MNKVVNKKTIELTGYIGEYGNDFDAVNEQLMWVSATETLVVNVSGKGGSYFQAMKIYDRLKQHKGKTVIRVSPVAYSAHAVIALVPGAKVVMPENGLMFHHTPEVEQDQAKNPEELRAMADQLETIGSTLVTMVSDRCGKSKEIVKNMLDRGQWFTAQQAKDYGLIDEVEPLSKKRMAVTNVMPDSIVAFVNDSNIRVNSMALKEVCSKLELEVTDEMSEDQFETAIVDHVGNLTTQISTLKEEIKKLPPKKEEVKFSDGIAKVLCSTREMEITNLVKEGKITKAVADKFIDRFAKVENVTNYFNQEGDPVDGFDGVIAALTENEKVINFGDQRAKTKLDQGGGEPKESVVVTNAKQRSEHN